MWVLVFSLLSVSAVKSLLDLSTPLVEDLLKMIDHVVVWVLGGMNVLGVVLILWVEVIKSDVVLETLEGFLQLT